MQSNPEHEICGLEIDVFVVPDSDAPGFGVCMFVGKHLVDELPICINPLARITECS